MDAINCSSLITDPELPAMPILFQHAASTLSQDMVTAFGSDCTMNLQPDVGTRGCSTSTAGPVSWSTTPRAPAAASSTCGSFRTACTLAQR